MKAQRKSFGFTLIELLVVIAIIAILAAILFPVFAQARESARTTSCLSNTKQIGLGIMQYVQDYDERFPIWMYDDPVTPARNDRPWGTWQYLHNGWDNEVQPYVKNIQVFRCPTANDGQDTSSAGDDSKMTGASNYAMNGRLTGRDQNSRAGLKIASVRYPAVTIMVVEADHRAGRGSVTSEVNWMEWGWQGGHSEKLNGDNHADAGWDQNDYKSRYTALCKQGTGSAWGAVAPLRRHRGGSNYAFADGHSKFYTGDASCVVWDVTGSPARNESGGTMTYIP